MLGWNGAEEGSGSTRRPFDRPCSFRGGYCGVAASEGTAAVTVCCFGQKNGWERPNWFALGSMKQVMEYSFGRQNWFECHAAEHKACRERVAIFDQTGFSKYVLTGSDSLRVELVSSTLRSS